MPVSPRPNTAPGRHRSGGEKRLKKGSDFFKGLNRKNFAGCSRAPDRSRLDYRLALTLQGKDWELSGADGLFQGSGPFLHADRDPAVYGGMNTIATGEGQQSYLVLPWIPKR
nr:transcription factor P53 - C terminal domain protein [uncultured bacterium]